ncbi:hypothetical protein BH10PSE1_BH10PSE1_18200 [soil metagenome]
MSVPLARIGVRLALALALTLGLSVAGPASAHKGHAGLTVVEIDPAGGGVTVVHRFYAHDVEPALASLAPDAQPSLDDPQAVAALEAHLATRFRLDVDGVRIPLHHTGDSLTGDNVRVDLAGERAPGPVRQVRVDVDFFPDVYDNMEMQVNVRVAGVTRTAVFHSGTRAQTLEFTD